MGVEKRKKVDLYGILIVGVIYSLIGVGSENISIYNFILPIFTVVGYLYLLNNLSNKNINKILFIFSLGIYLLNTLIYLSFYKLSIFLFFSFFLAIFIFVLIWKYLKNNITSLSKIKKYRSISPKRLAIIVTAAAIGTVNPKIGIYIAYILINFLLMYVLAKFLYIYDGGTNEREYMEQY